ncbi:MAG: class I SAM-dependent methyltransferase [Acidimicrobiales bacterium]
MDRQGWDERYAASDQTFLRDPNRQVVEEIGSLPPGRALDLATGEGRHAVWLAALGWHVVAVDFSEVGLRRGQARAREEGHPVHFVQADVHTLRLPAGRFDLVLAAFFHPRPTERTALYPSMAQALAPGGSLLQVSYDRANLDEGTGGPKDPDFLLDPPVLAAELEALGLEVTRAESVRLRAPKADGTEVDVVNAVIRAVRP